MREYLGVRVRLSVLGLWKTTEKRGFRDFFHVFFLTALAAWAALPLASFAVVHKQQKGGAVAPAAARQTGPRSGVTHRVDACYEAMVYLRASSTYALMLLACSSTSWLNCL